MTITSGDVQKYIQTVGHIVFTVLATSAGIDVSSNIQQLAIGVIGNIAMFAWTVYGTRINAKLKNVEAIPGVKIVVTDPTIAPPVVVDAAADSTRPNVVTVPGVSS